MFSGASFFNKGLVIGTLIGLFLLAPMMGTVSVLAVVIPAAIIGGVIEKLRMDQRSAAENPEAHPRRRVRLPFVSHVPKLDLQKELLPEIAQNSRHQLHADKFEGRGEHHGSYADMIAEERSVPRQR